MNRTPPPLPTPDPDAQALSERLQEKIRARITAEGGAIGFDRFMQMALYEPGLGYYSAGLAKFGAAGDFTTAPLVSSLFSQTLARQCAQCLRALGQGDILELGAGSGRMAADVLSELAELDALPRRYLILEVSAELRQRQQELLTTELPHLIDRVEWLDTLPENPLTGVMLANEVADALPVQRFRVGERAVEELAVRLEGGGLDGEYRAAPPALAEAVRAIEQDCGYTLPVGYSSEYCAQLPAWMSALAERLERGVLLLVDYGYPRSDYYHPHRHMGTLMCHYRHRAHDDALALVGLQDITAFVDFTAAALAGVEAGLDVLGFTTQAQFLLGAGLLDVVAQRASQSSPEEQVRLAQQVKLLTLPGEMGERFKVLALGRGVDEALAGFALADLSSRL
jgi:SAM-dependent MidA family methyltransferase